MNDRSTVLLADDHPIVRKGLRKVIEEDGSFAVVGEAGNGEQALRFIEEHTPFVAVLDIDMPKMTGLEVAEALQRKKLPTQIIVMTMYDKETIFNRAIDLGAFGYVMKDSALTEIVEALASVARGKYYISPALSGHLVQRGGSSPSATEDKLGLSILTQSERKILRLIAHGKSTKEIAEEFFISPRTVDTHRSNICSKLEVSGTNALLRFAMEHKAIL